MSAPPPARDDLSTPEALRRGLDVLAGLDPHYDVEAGLVRFEAATATGKAATGGGATLKLIVGSLLLIVTVAALGAFATAKQREPSVVGAGVPQGAVSAPSPNPPAHHEPDLSALGEAEVGEPSEPTPAVPAELEGPDHISPSVVPVAEPKARRRRPNRTSSAPTPSPKKPDSLRAEMLLLNSTRKQVSSGSFSGALASIAAAEELDAPRHFGEEWDALEILALAGSGRTERARKLAAPYLSRHPKGRFTASIERALKPETTVPQ